MENHFDLLILGSDSTVFAAAMAMKIAAISYLKDPAKLSSCGE